MNCQNDQPLAQLPYQLQQQLTSLKMMYAKKKEALVGKLDRHQYKIESIFKMFYDTLYKMRNDMLSQEYAMRTKMDKFEDRTRALVNQLKTYSLIEFYHEQD